MLTAEPTTKERPILFSPAMVRAILDGRKTQTRRVVKSLTGTDIDPNLIHRCRPFRRGEYEFMCDGYGGEISVKPYAFPGDRLWVRETWHANHDRRIVHYRADYPDRNPFSADECGEDCSLVGERWRPSIHMPRKISRLMLRVNSVRVERVQDIDKYDAEAEGMKPCEPEDSHDEGYCPKFYAQQCRDIFPALWDSINAKRGFGWDVNPWVWVVEFELEQSARS